VTEEKVWVKLLEPITYLWKNSKEFRVGYGLKDEALEAFRLSGFEWHPLPLVGYPDLIEERYEGCDMSVLTAAGFILEKEK
jgi:hypothetical protein